MDAVRITDFPLVQEYELRDKLHLQRQEAGIWNDYHTDLGSYLGEVRTAVFDWDISNPGELFQIPCPSGRYLILLGGHQTYKPGAVFSGNLIQIAIQTVSANWAYLTEFFHDGSGNGLVFTPNQGSGPNANIYGDVGEDLLISTSDSGLVSPNQGTCRIVVQYVEVTPL